MEMNFQQMLDKVTDHLKTLAKTDTVIGEQFTLGEYTCVPVMKIGMGFGSGGGSGDGKAGKGTGGGAGAGLGMTPMGFLVTRGDEIAMIPAGKSKGLAAMFEKIPDVLEKYLEKEKTEEDTESTKEA